MTAYGLDISEVMGWTYPQLRLLKRYRDQRINDERRWALFLASGTLAPEMFDQLWQALGGEKLDLKSQQPASSRGLNPGDVDDEGNVIAPPGTPLLSDIASGKVPAPSLIPIMGLKTPQEKHGI
mgnify:CR=1 FL=1